MTTAPAKSKKRFILRAPALYPKQRRAMFCRERFSWTEASTKSGKTIGALSWLIELAVMGGKPGREYWWIAPIIPQSKIAYRRAKRAIPPQTYKANETELTLTLFNGAVLRFKGGDNPDSLYGEDVYAAVIDEASRMREEVWTAIRSTITATRGPVRIIGNVKGRRNWFYRMARQAEAGAPDSAYHRITAQDAIEAGVLVQEEIDAARLQLPANVARELFDAIASDDEGNPFTFEAIQRQIATMSTSPPVVWGWDLAKYQDWTVGIALDTNGVVCRFERFQNAWEETIDKIEERIHGTKTVIDATGVGDPIVERIIRHGFKVEPYVFTSASKQPLMEGLAVAIQSGDIWYPPGVIVNELEAFEYVYTRTGVKYSAPAGEWDDTVIALGLAVHGAKFGKSDIPIPVPTYPGQTAGDNRGVGTLGNF